MAFTLVRFARTSLDLSSLEYAMVVAVIALAVSADPTLLGDEIRGAIESIADRVSGIAAPNGG